MATLPVRTNGVGESSKENQRPTKQTGKVGHQKRNALGNVTNQVRVQPVRAAKDKHSVLHPLKGQASGQENVGMHSKKAGGFSIFQDSAPVQQPMGSLRVSHHVHVDESMHDQENMIPEVDLKLPRAVADLKSHVGPSHHQPLAPLHMEMEPMAQSPMVVDAPIQKEPGVRVRAMDEFGLDPYFEDIYDYLRSIELFYRPNSEYMNRQSDVTTSMRNILVDWLVEVGEEYKLHRETLFLAISYVDKFLSLVGVQRPKLQLVGAACMFIAGKYEEIYPPDVAEFVYITDDTYTRNQVLKMESVILKLLDFRVAVPTINWFADRFMEMLEMSETSRFLTYYLIELSLIEIEEFLQYRPSMVAATAVVLARTCLQEDQVWPMLLEDVSKYAIPDLKQCLTSMFNLYTRAKNMPQQAVPEKYKQEKYGRVAFLPPPAMLSIP